MRLMNDGGITMPKSTAGILNHPIHSLITPYYIVISMISSLKGNLKENADHKKGT